MSDPLHLPNLTIRGFRGIDQLTIPRLGRVTLLAGKNGVGKSTVLEAVRVFAARGRFSVLSDLLRNREEAYLGSDDNGAGTSELDSASLFHRRDLSDNTKILIGPESTSEQLQIEITSLAKMRSTLLNIADPIQGLAVSFRGKRQVHWFIPSGGLAEFSRSYRIPENDDPEARLTCEFLGPDILREIDVARLWDNVAWTDDEHRAVSALELIIGNGVTGVALIGDGKSKGNRPPSRRNQVIHALSRADVTAPGEPDPGGTIIANRPRIGIWLMPDNVSAGQVEEFFAGMIPTNDSVWPRSEA